jgi:uncharacterized repeat protein (TIGR01451 family)
MGTRFDGAAMAAVTLLTLGAVLGNAVLVVAAAVPATYLLAETLATPPDPASLAVERTIGTPVVTPGQRTTITVTVRNEGDRPMPDVRVVDRPPEGVTVDGRPARGCLSVRPGESESFSYEAVAGHGEHAFDDPVVRLRSLSAVGARTARPTAAGDATLSCRRAEASPSFRAAARRQIGTRPADSPGSGLEFHSIREYRHGDDVSRVDWRRFAKTGDLATVNFREPHATATVVVVDARRPTRVSRRPGAPTAAALSADAGERVFGRLADAGNRVGLTALGLTADDVDAPVRSDRADRPWVPVGDDGTTRTTGTAVFDAVLSVAAEPLPSAPPRTTDGVQRRVDPARPDALRDRFPGSAAVAVATPVLDDEAVALVEALSAAGHPVLVVSPDVTGRGSLGARVAATERRLRLRRLRACDARVVDWDPTEPLSVTTEGSL